MTDDAEDPFRPTIGSLVSSSGSGNAAGQDVNSVGSMMVVNHVGSTGPDLSVQAKHYDEKVVENAQLKLTVNQLSQQLADQRAKLSQQAQHHKRSLDDQDRAHADAAARLEDRHRAEAEAYQVEGESLRQRIHDLEEQASLLRSQHAARSKEFLSAALTLLGKALSQISSRTWRFGAAGLAIGAFVGAGGVAVHRGDEQPAAATSQQAFTTPSAGASVSPVELTDVPCQSGRWAVRFASFLPRDAGALGLSMDDLVRARLTELDNRRTIQGLDAADHTFQATGPSNIVCPGLIHGDPRGAERTYVFTGPMSEHEAKSLCALLHYGNGADGSWDCLATRLSPTAPRSPKPPVSPTDIALDAG